MIAFIHQLRFPTLDLKWNKAHQAGLQACTKHCDMTCLRPFLYSIQQQRVGFHLRHQVEKKASDLEKEEGPSPISLWFLLVHRFSIFVLREAGDVRRSRHGIARAD